MNLPAILLLTAAIVSGSICPVSAASSASSAPATQRKYVWIEAESPKSTNFPSFDRNPFAPLGNAEAEVLSGGRWIGADGMRASPLFAEYIFTAPAAGKYQVFARKFWKHGAYRWRIGSQPWQNIGPDVALLDEATLRLHVEANWTSAGSATLTRGSHTLRIESTASEGAIAFDAFLLTMDPFIPRGKLKPGEKYNRAPAGYFAFEPDSDPFLESPIDLRSLNEKFAGANGFIQTRGEEFIHGGNGEPVRFWAQNTSIDALALDDTSLARFARSMAKQGVNLVRLPGPPVGSDLRQGDAGHAQRVLRFVAAMKKEGIYTCLTVYFPLSLQPSSKQLSGYDGSQKAFAAVYFNPDLQKSYRNWWTTLLTTADPKTGHTLRDDPAVAMLEMVNEDSYFFWTFSPYENIPAGQMAILERQFGDWLQKKYGSLDDAFRIWKSGRKRGDEPAAGRAGFRTVWEMANVKDLRSRDTVAFLAASQRRFYDETFAFLKKDLRYRGLVYASNWITADPRVLGPIDKWTNAGADFMDRHGYFDIGHEGDGASYSIRQGHTFSDASALKFPGNNFSLPIFDIRYDNKPSTITEINWTPPNRLRADLPLGAAAYGLLQGTDAVFFFWTTSPSWEDGIDKFGLRTPVIAGQYPATAYLYRKGLIKAGPVAVEANLSLRNLFDLKGAPVTAPLNLDKLRAADVPGQPRKVDALDGIDPLAFLVGKVAVNFVPADRPSSTINLGRYIDRRAMVVRSATGELSWDYGKGLITVNAPMAQGLTGFLKTARLATADVDASVPLDYGTVLLVALDGKPIRESSKILMQVMSQESVYGFQTSGRDKLTITNLGSAPLVVKKLRGTVMLKRADAETLRVTALDANGYPHRKLGSARRIELLEDVFYYIIEK